MATEQTPKTLAKQRTLHSGYILMLLVASWYLYKYSADIMRMISGHQEVADMGVEALQPLVIAMIYVCVGAFFSTLMGAFLVPQFKESSFAGWSRFGILWLFSFGAFIYVAAALL